MMSGSSTTAAEESGTAQRPMTARQDLKEGRQSPFCGPLCVALYKRIRSPSLRSVLRRLILRLEGGAIYSLSIREILRRFHGVQVGLYTIGPCEGDPGAYPRGTVIGRYCSLYWTARVMRSDQPPDDELLHVVAAGVAPERKTAASGDVQGLVIGNDVFIGHNTIILPGVGRIGDGSFIGAGSVVHNPVPPYAVVTGNPARVVRYRFSKEKIQELLESEWWQKSIDELSGEMERFQQPVEGSGV